jgi:hypothetical protein
MPRATAPWRYLVSSSTCSDNIIVYSHTYYLTYPGLRIQLGPESEIFELLEDFISFVLALEVKKLVRGYRYLICLYRS